MNVTIQGAVFRKVLRGKLLSGSGKKVNLQLLVEFIIVQG